MIHERDATGAMAEQARHAMRAALGAAADAAGHGDVPVGAAVFDRDGIVSVERNRREADSDPTAHAEILAIRAAAQARGSWRLDGCGLAVTLEPCAMCAGAIVLARLDLVAYGADDPKAGAAGSLYNICQDARLNHETELVYGLEEAASRWMLQDFFSSRRANSD